MTLIAIYQYRNKLYKVKNNFLDNDMLNYFKDDIENFLTAFWRKLLFGLVVREMIVLKIPIYSVFSVNSI